MNNKFFNENSIIFTNILLNLNFQRMFFFITFSGKFFNQLKNIFNEHHVQNLSTQKALFT